MATRKLLKTDTWLPIFSGFYETIWDGGSDAELEMYNINETRHEKGLPDCDKDVEWDYETYEKEVAQGVTQYVGDYLKEHGYIHGYKYQEVSSPREYNYRNDSIHVQFTFNKSNVKQVMDYLAAHREAFATYLECHYTSYDGFISSHSNDVGTWLSETVLAHEHKCGAVLNFIIRNEEKDMEQDIYEELSGNGVNLRAENYDALVEVA